MNRLATLADGGRIRCEDVEREIMRLKKQWQYHVDGKFVLCQQLLGERMVAIDEFDLYQLEGVLKICQQSHSLSEAGRKLFAQSRQQKASINDTDRLKKYLARFELTWPELKH